MHLPWFLTNFWCIMARYGDFSRRPAPHENLFFSSFQKLFGGPLGVCLGPEFSLKNGSRVTLEFWRKKSQKSYFWHSLGKKYLKSHKNCGAIFFKKSGQNRSESSGMDWFGMRKPFPTILIDFAPTFWEKKIALRFLWDFRYFLPKGVSKVRFLRFFSS